MTTEIGVKNTFFFNRGVAMLMMLLISLESFHKWIHTHSEYISGPINNDLLLTALMLLLFIYFSLQLIYYPIGVTISEDPASLTIKYFLTGKRVIEPNEITSYFEIYVNSRYGTTRGIVINLAQGKQVLISEMNLADYYPVQQFLNRHKITNEGEQSFSYISYIRHQRG